MTMRSTTVLNRRRISGAPSSWSRPLTFLLVIGIVLLYWLTVRVLTGVNAALNPPAWWATLQSEYPLVNVVAPAVNAGIELFAPRVLIHFFPLLFGVYAARYITLRVVQLLYDLPNEEAAAELLGRLRGVWHAKPLAIDRINFARQQVEEPVLRVGGPGTVTVSPTDLVVTERNGRYLRFLGPGKQELERFERVRNVLDLRDREQNASNIMLHTRDGLPLKTDIQITYRLRRSLSQPLLASSGGTNAGRAAAGRITDSRLITAVRKAAYAETVTDYGVSRWTDLPLPLAIGELRRLLLQLKLDDLLSTDQKPADAIYHQLHGDLETNVRARLDAVGIELLNVQFAALQLSDALQEVLIDYWKVKGDKAAAVPNTHDTKETPKIVARNQMTEHMMRALAEARARRR